jgi:uncharacterized protein DUF2846
MQEPALAAHVIARLIEHLDRRSALLLLSGRDFRLAGGWERRKYPSGGTRKLGRATEGGVMGANQRGRGAPWQLFSIFALAAVLAGCVTQSGPPLSSLATVGGPPKGMARIVVVRQEQTSFVLRNAAFTAKLDGEPLGELAVGTFAYLDRPGGSHQLSAEVWGNPGVTRRDLTAVSGRTYFFRASLNEKMNGLTAVSMISPLGGLVAAAATYDDRQGPVDLTPISEAEAKQAIAAAQ